MIFLTSKEEEVDEVLALKVGGAGIFIRKPFSQRLLLERVKVLLRRATSKDSPGSKMPVENVLDRGELHVDPERARPARGWANRDGHRVSSFAIAREPPRSGQKVATH